MADALIPVIMVTLFIAMAAGIVYVVYWVSHVQPRKRSQAIAALARHHGLQYIETHQSLTERWTGPPFDRSAGQEAHNVVSGTYRGREVVAFDFATIVRRSDQTDRTEYGVVVMRMPGALPPLQVNREGIYGHTAHAFTLHDLAAETGVTDVVNSLGRADIRFESEQFNRAFRVQAPDERFARAVVHPRMMELLMSRVEIAWRFDGDFVIGWHAREPQVGEVIWRLDLLGQIIDLVPPYVWRDYAGVDPSLDRQRQDRS